RVSARFRRVESPSPSGTTVATRGGRTPLTEALMNISTRTILGFALTALVTGCGGSSSSDDLQTATDGTAAVAGSAQSSSLADPLCENVSASDPATAAGQVAAATALWPSGCVTRTKDLTNPMMPVVHLTFNDCTGPFGMVHIDGDEDIVFTK